MLQRFECTSLVHLWMWWNTYRKHIVHLRGCVIFSERKASRLFCMSQGQCSEYVSGLVQNHGLSLFPTHPPPCAHPHPLPIPAVAFCLTAQAEPHALHPVPFSWHWNLNPDTWFLSNTGRSKPCMEDLVKSHRMAPVAGGIMPGIARDCTEESVVPDQWF